MDAPTAIPHKPVELARIETVKRAGTTLVIDYGVVTTGPARYEFFLQGANDRAFTPLTSDFPSADSVDTPTGRLTISLGTIAAGAYHVKMVVTPQTGEPVLDSNLRHRSSSFCGYPRMLGGDYCSNRLRR